MLAGAIDDAHAASADELLQPVAARVGGAQVVARLGAGGVAMGVPLVGVVEEEFLEPDRLAGVQDDGALQGESVDEGRRGGWIRQRMYHDSGPCAIWIKKLRCCIQSPLGGPFVRDGIYAIKRRP